MTKYRELSEGEWETPVIEGYKQQCCDCGLVHKLDFRLTDGRELEDGDLQIRFFRDNRATGQTRRRLKNEKIPLRERWRRDNASKKALGIVK